MYKNTISFSMHEIRVWYWEEYESGRNWLKVSVSFADKRGLPMKYCADCFIEKAFLESGTLYWDAEAWKEEQVPKLTEKVIKRLYAEKRRGNVWS